MPPRVLIFDIETLPNIVTAFQMKVPSKWINPQNILEEGHIASIAWKWLGAPRIYSVTAKVGAANPDLSALKKFSSVIQKADAIIAHNGDSFDVKVLNGRAVILGLPPFKPVVQIDTKKMAKKAFWLNAYSLDYICKVLGIPGKIPCPLSVWHRVMKGDRKALKELVKYNKNDVKVLENVYNRIQAFCPTQISYAIGADPSSSEAVVCPHCGSENTYRNGKIITKTGLWHRIGCRSCFAYSKKPVKGSQVAR